MIYVSGKGFCLIVFLKELFLTFPDLNYRGRECAPFIYEHKLTGGKEYVYNGLTDVVAL